MRIAPLLLAAARAADVLVSTALFEQLDYMEKTLAKRELTKEVEGRDPRYRPRTARQAYRPPVNVTTTGTPGIYRYQRPRFARPEIPQPTES